MESYNQYRRLLHYVKPHKIIFAVSIIATVVLATTEPVVAALMKPLLDGSFVDKDPTMIVLMPLLLVTLFVVRGIAGFISGTAMERVATHVVYDLRRQMIDRLLTLPSSYYDNNSAGVTLSKITFDVEQLTGAATKVLVVLVRDTIAIAGLLGWAIYLNWKLAPIALALVPIVVLLVRLISTRLRRISRTLQQYMGEMTHVLEEVIKGNRIVKLFGGQEYEKKRLQNSANKVRQYRVKNLTVSTANVQVIQIFAVTGLALMAYLAAKMDFTVGEFMSFFTAIALTLSPLKRLTAINSDLQRGLAAADTVFALLDQPPEHDAGQKRLSAEKIAGHLSIRSVGFSYPNHDETVLSDISIAIHPGENIALVGPSGSGKTSLTNLLPRFYTPSQGEILLEGTDIQKLPLNELRSHISLVSQDVVLFNDSIRANIAYGAAASANESNIVDAARAANALEFIEQMPEGMDTIIGDNGVRLSGGQRQRIAIARALLKDAPVLILDEATSALDTESEQLIQEAMDRLRKGRTTIIIAHRLSTIEHADKIIVLDKGAIVESGTHLELLKQDGLYSKLYQIQFAEQE
ncbi:lipid A export permease/ATP-binding protein MsbA [Solemya velesiana gill symbiont]|uniref:Lipid A export permease/ATP-binding protein MsbA n=1 Tax=Solemya velesiana gill symbiont TaxID=1918948 RepID=A0A1T2KXW4_9GAMM|nr:lipid A export permease/ATP-binding protein MsbA [Solemya velesiana gill symbiont]OOZ37673.1 lipid A export permease/ATP-binding protein MsbA [Solemya velesiana gill symbiont]